MSFPDASTPRLADGGAARIRPLRADDLEQVRALYRDSSDWARYLRFFTPVTVDGAVRLTSPASDDEEHCVLAAEVAGRVVGLGQYDVTDDDEVAEVAFMVEDDQQGRGLATLLLESLAQRATARGIRRFRAQFLRENERMPEVFARSGFDVHWSSDGVGIGTAEFELVPDERWEDAHRERASHAEARSIARLLRPRAIAVIGAGSSERSIGHAIVTNLVDGGFRGVVHPVNRHSTTVAGLPTVPSVLDVEGPLDLVVVAVPAADVLDVARQCAEQGVVGIVVVSGGFAELPDSGPLQAALLELCRRAGMRLVGPNCVGIANCDPAVSMNATFSPVAPIGGRVGFASQSGGVGIELLARARQLDLGISSFVSMGNKADVSTNDLMEYWRDDDATDVVVLYLESLGNPTKFARVARELTRAKPVVALKSGRTAPGARGTRSHTAALADPDTAVDAVLRSSGVIRVDTLAELFDVASLLSHQPPPAGRRVAVMSNGGGPAIVATDACVVAGLEVPELSPEVQTALHALAPTGGVSNPVDLVATASPEVFDRAAQILIQSNEIDALLVIHVAPFVTRADEIADAVSHAVRDTAGSVTVASCFLGLDETTSRSVRAGDRGRVPTFAAPESAARALAHAAELGVWRRRPDGRRTRPDVDHAAAAARVADVLATEPDGTWVAPTTTAAILADYGIATPAASIATSAEAAVAAGEAIGWPVAMKAIAPDVVHRSDVGGVALGLGDPRAVTDAFGRMHDAIEGMSGVYLQRMVPTGVEMIVGVHHDPSFGPLLVVGAGGVTAELDRDTALLVPPVSEAEIRDAIASLRRAPLLSGYRHTPLVDADALRALVARVGQLAIDVPELADLDCNPVIVSPAGAVVVDAKLRLVPRPHPPSPFDPS